MQDGEQLEWGVLGEPVHHHGALPLACGDEVAVVRHVADLGRGDGLDDGGCWGGHVDCHRPPATHSPNRLLSVPNSGIA